jgi:hypothetical protein
MSYYLTSFLPSHCLHSMLHASFTIGGSEHRKVAAACLYRVRRIRAKAFLRSKLRPFSEVKS